MVVAHRDELISQAAAKIVRFKNRLKAVFRTEVIQTDENSFYKNKVRIKELKNPAAKFVAEKLFDQIEFLESEKDKYKEVFERNRKKYRPIRQCKKASIPSGEHPKMDLMLG
jgi:hypothetical protein